MKLKGSPQRGQLWVTFCHICPSANASLLRALKAERGGHLQTSWSAMRQKSISATCQQALELGRLIANDYEVLPCVAYTEAGLETRDVFWLVDPTVHALGPTRAGGIQRFRPGPLLASA